MNNKVNHEDNDSKKILTLIALIAIIIITTTSATYAFFALSATNNSVITGTASTASLTLTVTEATLGGTNSGSSKTNVMVPQLESTLGTAMSSATGTDYKCVDANGNTVCKVYTIKVTNGSTAAVRLNGTIQFLAPKSSTAGTNTYTNLYWRKTTNTTTLGTGTSVQVKNSNNTAITSNTTVTDCSTTGNYCSQIYDIIAGTTCTVSSGSGCTRIPLASGASATYYIVIWINETSASQNSTDKGTWQAIISFMGENNKGITSTITG